MFNAKTLRHREIKLCDFAAFVFLISKYDYAQLRDRRAESPKAHSPGHRPVGLVSEFVRPARAKALICGNAFALTGRIY